MVVYSISDLCAGCTRCAKTCPNSAIYGSARQKHYIDREKCTGCGSCVSVCPRGAITAAGGESLSGPCQHIHETFGRGGPFGRHIHGRRGGPFSKHN